MPLSLDVRCTNLGKKFLFTQSNSEQLADSQEPTAGLQQLGKQVFHLEGMNLDGTPEGPM